ncbi:hypothetical protein D3C85_1730510 [compost metagenome]
MQVSDDGKQIEFFYKKAGTDWVSLHRTEFLAAKYVPWGMGYRAGIVVKGKPAQKGSFSSFAIRNN